MIKETLGHHKILDKLGAGGMGEVYLAEDTTLKRQVALKVLPPDLAANQELLERFQREAEILAALDHPNIVHVYSVEQDEGTHFLTMELVEGKPLSNLIPKGGMTLERIFDLATPLADALATAHEKGIIHRDLKPANIMVTDEGRVKVLDFGLAKLWQEVEAPLSTEQPTEPLTAEGRIIGTMPYMSPEQLEGKEIDARSDIFSLGVLLYEMGTGRRPFKGDSPASLISSILKDTPRDVDEIRESLPHHLGRIIQHCLRKEPQLRFQTARDVRNQLTELREELDFASKLDKAGFPEKRASRRILGSKLALSALLLLVVLLFATIALLMSLGKSKAAALSDTDVVLLTDFVNRTRDPIFDDTLQLALALKLEESPYLNILPERDVQEALGFMGRATDDRVTPEIAQEICERQGLKALVRGEIAPLGTNFVVTLTADECLSGKALAREQVQVSSKEEVLGAVGTAAVEIRRKLGESLASIEKYDAPVEQATTSSLEALKVFSSGEKLRAGGQEDQAIPLFKRAIELDPDFARAHGVLGTIYGNLREWEISREYLTRAFELRDQVSEREELYITAHYHSAVTGNAEKEIEAYEQFKQAYPRDWTPVNNLAVLFNDLGWFDKAIEESRVAVELNPNHAFPYSNLGEALRSLNQLTEAKQVYSEALEKGFTYHGLYIGRYLIAYQESDQATMQRMADSLSTDSGEAWMLATQANVAASGGRLNEARDLTSRAIDVATQFGFTEQTAFFMTWAAAYEAAFDNEERSREFALAALEIARSRDTMPYAAVILARAGAVEQAEALLEELMERFPDDTVINKVQAPIARAAIALQQQDPQRAVKLLEATIPYQRGQLWAIYLRGLAYLATSEPTKAMAEFLKLQDLGSVQPDLPVHTLTHLGLARAKASLGDNAAAHQEYEKFLEIVKDADEGLPIVEEARAEYEALISN